MNPILNNEELPLISVLIPTYNVEKYVEEAVRSIISQTYSNLEIIIVDDCSKDRTFEILDKLRLSDNRIKLFRNDVNKKIVDTLNFAFLKSKGEFIARMDGDDVSCPSRIAEKFEFLKQNSDIDLVGCQPISIDELGNTLNEHKLFTDERLIYKSLMLTSPVLHIWLARRAVYEKLKGYRISPTEDYDFLLRMRTSGFRFTNIDKALYKVRIRKGNTLTTQGLKQRKAFNYARELYKQRLKNGTDSYSYEGYCKAVKTSVVGNYLFSLSVGLLNRAVKNKSKNRLLSYFLILFSAFFSIYQVQYLLLLFKLNRLKNE
jgi:glycosyltransferase involved in cell wall biosynthesis